MSEVSAIDESFKVYQCPECAVKSKKPVEVEAVPPDPMDAPFVGEPVGVPVPGPSPEFMAAREERFRKELESLINSHSRENGSNTPDFIIAQFLYSVLMAWDAAVTRRSEWYGGKDRIDTKGAV